uniref:Salivary lipocalin n=1 Tax=Triatoma matogrossensis TaxID=162370 RepID=E2J712_9HEMI
MKTIITVIFVGILTYTVAQRCPNVPSPMKNLNVNEFFNGAWYTTHMKDAANSATCRTYKFRVLPGGVELTYEGYIMDGGFRKDYNVICSSKDQQVNPSASVPFKCAQKYKTGNEFFDLTLTVIYADKDYGFVHRCIKFDEESTYSGFFLLLHRDKNADGSKAAKSLTANKLDLKSFKKYNC